MTYLWLKSNLQLTDHVVTLPQNSLLHETDILSGADFHNPRSPSSSMLLYLFLIVFVVTTFTDFCPFFYWGCGAFNVTSNEELLGYNFDKLSKFLPNTLPNNKLFLFILCPSLCCCGSVWYF